MGSAARMGRRTSRKLPGRRLPYRETADDGVDVPRSRERFATLAQSLSANAPSARALKTQRKERHGDRAATRRWSATGEGKEADGNGLLRDDQKTLALVVGSSFISSPSSSSSSSFRLASRRPARSLVRSLTRRAEEFPPGVKTEFAASSPPRQNRSRPAEIVFPAFDAPSSAPPYRRARSPELVPPSRRTTADHEFRRGEVFGAR